MKGLVVFAATLGAVLSLGMKPAGAAGDPLGTRPGWEAGGQIAHYHYEEPNFAKLAGPRVGPAGAFTFVRWGIFVRADARVSAGSLKYQGSGTMNNVPDSIFEARGVVGTDLRAGNRVSFSPYAGLGYRYLYDDLRGRTSTNRAGYRRYSNYLYAPVGLTARFRTAGEWILAPTAEYDFFIRGRQESKLSDAGFGDPDVTNTQKSGRGYRVALMAEADRFAFGPWLHYWKIADSDCVPIGPGVCGLEPENWTREVGLEVRYRF